MNPFPSSLLMLTLGAVVAGSAPVNGDARAQSAPATQPSGAPHRAPGLWRQTVEIPGAPMGMPTIEACVDATSETHANLLGHLNRAQVCDQPQFGRNAVGALTLKTVCTLPRGGKSISTATISGNFSATYQAVIDVAYEGAPEVAARAPKRIIITATRLGECQAGQKGGDVMIAGRLIRSQGGGNPP